MKKLLSVFLCLTVWLSVSAYDFEVDGIYYNIIGNGQVEVTCQAYDSQDPFNSYSSYSGVYTIPSSVTYNSVNYSVTSIGDYAFYYCSGWLSVDIPNSVTSIGDCAFCGCSALTSVDIPNSVTSIGPGAFWYCSNLTSVTIPNGVTSIDVSAFRDCSSLMSVVIPNSVTSINTAAFYGCSSLTSVTIPNSVNSIGDYAFYGCSSLTSVTIPNSVTSIGESAFENCSSLTSVTIPNSVTSIGEVAFWGCRSLTSVTIPNSVNSIGDYAFCGCSSLTSVSISNNLAAIEYGVFYGCSSLTSLVIPGSVTSIGSNAFAGCTNIADITCHATTPPTIQSNTFANYNATLYVPASSISLYQSAEYWRNFNIQSLSGATYTITVNSNNDQMGTTIGGENYESNTNARLIAVPHVGYIFQRWSDGNTDNPRNVVVTQDSTFTAYFADPASVHDTIIRIDTLIVRDTVYELRYDTVVRIDTLYEIIRDTVYEVVYDTVYITQTDTIYLEYDGKDAMQYTLEDYGVYYLGGKVYNSQNQYIKLYYSDGKLISTGTNDIDMSSCPNGIYIVTDGKGGFLKINHYR